VVPEPTNYLYDGPALLEEVDAAGNVLARYTHGQFLDEQLSELRSNTTSYYEADGLDSVTSLSNASGGLANTYSYDSFGNLTASTGTATNPLRYTGREFDSETGIYNYRARYYDRSTGRFISEDPISFLGGTNVYRYVDNSPSNLVDPTGLYTEVIIWNPVGSGESSFGHVSVIINGTSYSWGPGPGNSVANKCCKPGKMDVETPPTPFIDKNTKFRSGLGYVLNLTGDQETRLAKYLNGFKGNYNVLSRNCGDPLVTGLRSIGIDLVFESSPFVTMPDDIDYGLGHTPGLVTGWVPHPQVGK